MENKSEESYKNLEEKFNKMRTSFENGSLKIQNVSLEKWMEPWEGLLNHEEENGRLRYAIKNMFHIEKYTSEELEKKCKKEGIVEENDRDRKNKLLKAFIDAGQWWGGARKSRRKSRRKKRRKSRRKKRRKTKRRKKRRKSRRKTRRKTKRRKTKNHK